MLLSNFASSGHIICQLDGSWRIYQLNTAGPGTLLGGGWSTTTTGRGGRRSRRNSSTSLQPTSPSSVQSELSTIAAIIFISRNTRRGFKWKLGGWKPLITSVNATAKIVPYWIANMCLCLCFVRLFQLHSTSHCMKIQARNIITIKIEALLFFVLYVSNQCLSFASISFCWHCVSEGCQ